MKASEPYHPYQTDRLKDPDYAIQYIKTVCQKDDVTKDEHALLIKSALADILEAYGGNHAAFRSPQEMAQVEKDWSEQMSINQERDG